MAAEAQVPKSNQNGQPPGSQPEASARPADTDTTPTTPTAALVSYGMLETVMRSVIACLSLFLITGCVAQRITYSPAANQAVVYDQGVAEITWASDDYFLTMFPTFRYQSASDVPTLTLMVQNKSDHDIDFDPANIRAWLDNRECHVYSLDERVGEIRTAAKRKQIALVIGGALAAGLEAYDASHQTATYSHHGTATNVNSHGGVRQTSVFTSRTVQTYDPAAGILAGAAIAADAEQGIQQIASAAGHQEQAAQAIFQRTTIHPGMTIVGQVMLKLLTNDGTLRVDVPVGGATSTFMFAKARSREVTAFRTERLAFGPHGFFIVMKER